MPLFLVTSLYDEGISSNCFRVVEADSKLTIAQHMLDHPDQWSYFLYRSLHRDLENGEFTPHELLDWMERTHVDGDSSAQLQIHPITVQSLHELNTEPSFQRGALFSDFG